MDQAAKYTHPRIGMIIGYYSSILSQIVDICKYLLMSTQYPQNYYANIPSENLLKSMLTLRQKC
jgi:hypothetical protein